MNNIKKLIFKTETQSTNCINYTVSSSDPLSQPYSFLDCTSILVNSNVGGVDGMTSETFCAIENSIVKTVDTSITNNGLCVPDTIKKITIVQDNCDGIFTIRILPEVTVTVEITSNFLSVATYIPVIGLPVLPGQTGIDTDTTVNISTDTTYIFGMNAKAGVGFTSSIFIKVTDLATSNILFTNTFNRIHTNEVC